LDARQYGVIEGEEVEGGVYRVSGAVEKPEKPPTNLAITAIYSFDPVVFKALERTAPGKKGEIQLTDAIQKDAQMSAGPRGYWDGYQELI